MNAFGLSHQILYKRGPLYFEIMILFAGVAGIKYSYCYELRDSGKTGFLLPPKQIKPSGIETFNSVRAMAIGLRDILKGQDQDDD